MLGCSSESEYKVRILG